MVMVAGNQQKENSIPEADDNTLREERRRTGRYVAAGTAIFLSLLGMYEAIRQGSREFAAVFLTAVIMFGYIGWLVYASKRRKYLRVASLVNRANIESANAPPKVAEKEKFKDSETREGNRIIFHTPEDANCGTGNDKEIDDFDKLVLEISEVGNRTFNRTYSVS